MLGELRAARRQRGDHRDEARAEGRRDRRGAAATRHRLGRREPHDEVVERSGRRSDSVGHRDVVPPDAIVRSARTSRGARRGERGGRGTGAPAPSCDDRPGGGGCCASRCGWAVRRRLVEAGDGPAARPVLEGQGQASSRRLHLEQRARTGDDRIGRRFLADAARWVIGSRSSPQVISRGRPLNQSVRTWTWTGSTRMNAMSDGSFPGASRYGSRRPGHSADRTSVR